MKVEIEEPQNNKQKKTNEAPFYWILGSMLFIIALSLVALTLKGEANSFDYEGLDFKKEMFGNIPIYKHTYLTEKFVTTAGNVIGTGKARTVTLQLRNDPRELEDIPVEGRIEFLEREKRIYITFDSSEGLLCDYSPIAAHQLSLFLKQNAYNVKAGTSDEEASQERELDYITCENRPERMVISFVSGDETTIERQDNCYTITVANCEILPAAEKFIIQALVDAREETTS